MSRRWRADELLALVLDPGSAESWDVPVDQGEVSPTYAAQLTRAREKSGVDESIITDRGRVRGREVAYVVNEFDFLAGSIGQAAARRIIDAVRRATAEGLPLLASTASGGTRMQEGTHAFVQMIEISRALMAHRAARLPYLVHLRHPTTGGVFASWGSLAHLTVAEPGALVGFLGPRVYEALHGEVFPAGVQTAENLTAHGVLDAVVPAEALPGLVDKALATLVDGPGDPDLVPPRLIRFDDLPDPRSCPAPDAAAAWEHITRSRDPVRPGVRDLLRVAGSRTVRLRGTAEGERDSAVIVALTRLDQQPCVLVGQDRSRQGPTTPMGPAALRQARRGIRFAEEVGLPLVTVIDTPGAELSPAAEEGAIAGEIARCISAMSTLTVPSVALLLGEGCGGGALALLGAEHVIAAEHAWLSPLPPEGASVILHGDTSHAADLAAQQRVSSPDLLRAGVVHAVVPEPEGLGPQGAAGSGSDAVALAAAAAVASRLCKVVARR